MDRHNDHPTSESEPLELDLDYPTHAGWWEASAAAPTAADEAMLGRRFAETDVAIESLVDAVHLASMQAATRRREAQANNRAKLRLSEAQSRNYDRLTASTENIGEFVDWFMRAANGAFNWAPIRHLDMDHVALDMFGKLQRGDWDAAAPVDTLVRRLPTRTADKDLNWIPTNKRTAVRSYTLTPMYDSGSSIDPHVFDYALLARDRLVGRVATQRGQSADVRKRSLALVVMSEMPEDRRTLIQGRFRAIDDPREKMNYIQTSNTTAAIMAGEVFEEAVQEREDNTAMVPISAHLIIHALRLNYQGGGRA